MVLTLVMCLIYSRRGRDNLARLPPSLEPSILCVESRFLSLIGYEPAGGMFLLRVQRWPLLIGSSYTC